MEAAAQSVLRAELVDRQQRLRSALGVTRRPEHLAGLLKEVDAALERFDNSTYGLCLVCGDAVEEERLLVDPLMQYCVDHLNPDQRRALQDDLDLAARIQRELLPRQGLEHAGWSVHYHYEGAGPVSGDYCDLIPLSDGSAGLLFLLGDVAGKGVAASMLMSNLQATFRSLTTVGLPVDQMIVRANRAFCNSTVPTHYATLIVGSGSADGHVRICNAGHCPALVLRASGEVSVFESTGLPLGLFCDYVPRLDSVHLDRGDSIVLFTDGLTEARNSDGSEFGIERVMQQLTRNTQREPRDLVSVLREDVHVYRKPPVDDLTIMVLRRTV